MRQFYLGTHRPHWLGLVDVPLFVSHRQLRRYRTLPVASAPWALDSGGFTELSLHGRWVTTSSEYVAAVRRYSDEVGMLAWASPQDWMNEPAMLAWTGLTVEEHQRRTVDNFLDLRTLAPELPFVPVVQGWEPDDYDRCVDLYERAGVDLGVEPVVGVGTVCRRQDTETGAAIFTRLAERGLHLHGFGVKLTGLRLYGDHLDSADSLAWSYRARRAGMDRRKTGGPTPPCGKSTCANCLHFALAWRAQAVAAAGLPVKP